MVESWKPDLENTGSSGSIAGLTATGEHIKKHRDHEFSSDSVTVLPQIIPPFRIVLTKYFIPWMDPFKLLDPLIFLLYIQFANFRTVRGNLSRSIYLFTVKVLYQVPTILPQAINS